MGKICIDDWEKEGKPTPIKLGEDKLQRDILYSTTGKYHIDMHKDDHGDYFASVHITDNEVTLMAFVDAPCIGAILPCMADTMYVEFTIGYKEVNGYYISIKHAETIDQEDVEN